MQSSFQQTTFLPSARSARVRPNWEPTQSPSGRIWPTMQKVRQSRMLSMIRSMILGWGFINYSLMQATWREPAIETPSFLDGFVGFVRVLLLLLVQFIENLHHAVTANNRIVHDETKFGRVFEDDAVGHLTLNTK